MTLYVASQRVFIVVVCFVIDSVRKLFDTPSYSRKVTFTNKINTWYSVPIFACVRGRIALMKFNCTNFFNKLMEHQFWGSKIVSFFRILNHSFWEEPSVFNKENDEHEIR
jgi:hypothetical protein